MNLQVINHLCFSVSNLNGPLILQGRVWSQAAGQGRKLAYFDLNGLWIALNEEDVDRSTANRTYTHIAFTINEQAVEPTLHRLQSLQVEILPGRARDEKDKKSIYFLDPDGHMFEFHTGGLQDRLDYYRADKEHMIFTIPNSWGRNDSNSRGDETMNLANRITIARMLLIPVFILFCRVSIMVDREQPPLRFIHAYGTYIALGVFIFASATDKLDGYIARKMNQITNLGKLLDPLADKLLISVALIMMVQSGMVATWIPAAIIAREFVITGLRMVASEQGIALSADRLGKLKMVLQVTAIAAVLLDTARLRSLDGSSGRIAHACGCSLNDILRHSLFIEQC